ncbi:MAG: hypothetical protein M3198_09165 [Actinomycetota bacterium]|nr:hypothetical protein [Actinomycetota bacterium]
MTMTLMLAGSILLIAGSAVALVMGWMNANESYIWTSIGATVGAAVLLAVAFFRSRALQPATRPEDETRGAEIDPEILADREERSRSKYARATSRGSEGDSETQVLAPDASAGAGAATAATVGPPAGSEPAKQDADAGERSGDSSAGEPAATVVSIPKTKKFHRSDCRFASAKDTETIDRSDAVSRGFEPCAVCKP